jgi:hypothetical protein
VFWAGPGAEFRYEDSVVAWAEIGSEKQTLSLALPAIRQARLRLCLADRPGFVRLYAASLDTAMGKTIWDWGWKDGAQRLAVESHHVVLQSADACVSASVHDAESWLELPLSAVDVPAGATFRLELGWPMSADFLAARRGWQDATGVLQDRLEQVSAIVAERDRQLVEVNTAREERERIIAERDRQLVEVNASREERERTIAERERTIAERERELDQANTARAGLETEVERSAETIAGLAQRCDTLESEKTRLEAALDARERAIANLQSFRSWLAWTSRRLRQRLARSR